MLRHLRGEWSWSYRIHTDRLLVEGEFGAEEACEVVGGCFGDVVRELCMVSKRERGEVETNVRVSELAAESR